MAKTNTITLTLTSAQGERLYNAWQDARDEKIPAYALWQLRPENCVITRYASGKTVFQGKDAEVYASPFLDGGDRLPQAGSDEVGTGDYFGPVCVCACIVQPGQVQQLHQLGVRDSKAVTDEEIRTIAPALMKLLEYSLLIVSDEKYNQVHDQSNMNAIKARLHNQAYVNLQKKTVLPDFRIIDQFTPEPQYYRYLSREKAVVRGIHFETKAENKYPAVGAASIIARYAFLRSMDAMEKTYGMSFHKGAGSQTDLDAGTFVQRYGFAKLSKVAKLHFKNTERLRPENTKE